MANTVNALHLIEGRFCFHFRSLCPLKSNQFTRLLAVDMDMSALDFTFLELFMGSVQVPPVITFFLPRLSDDMIAVKTT